jgi:hypothetical protein
MAGLGVISQLVGFVAQKVLPQPTPDNSSAGANIRLGTYGEVAVNNYILKKHALAAEGSYFVTTNVPGTSAGAGPASIASYANTAAWWFLQNNNPAGGPTVYPDYLKIIVTGAQTGGTITNVNFAVIRDVATPLSLQVTTATSLATATPVNTKAGGNPSGCVFGYQAGTTALVNVAPSSASAVVGRASLGVGGVSGRGLIGDEYVLDFGATDPAPYQGLTATEAVLAGRRVSILPPLAIPPGQQIMIVPWWPTATTVGMNYEFELTHVER